MAVAVLQIGDINKKFFAEFMKSVIVDVKELLEKVKANREAHKLLYLEAVEGYKKSIIKMRKAGLKNAKKGIFETSYSLLEPSNRLADYDRIILMLEMTTSVTVELNSQEFDCYVMDNWN